MRMHARSGGDAADTPRVDQIGGSRRDLLSVVVAGQTLALPVVDVREVLPARGITPVPLAALAVAGLVNVRGHILPAVDLGVVTGLRQRPGAAKLAVVVDRGVEPLCLLVDDIGDVMALGEAAARTPPANLGARLAVLVARAHVPNAVLILELDLDRVLAALAGEDGRAR